MRTRHSNKTKRFFDAAPDVGGDDEVLQARAGEDSDDENFALGDAAESDVSADGGSDLEGDWGAEAGGPAGSRRKLTRASRRTRQAPAPAAGSGPSPGPGSASGAKRQDDDPHELPPYVSETRLVTRVYTGELRRHARYSVLRDLMYGPAYGSVKLIYDLLTRWSQYPVLPARFPPSNPKGVVPSPWVPSNFEAGQESVVRRWYSNCRAGASATQQSHTVISKHGLMLLPRPDGDLATLIGPWDSQREHIVQQGDSLALSQSGLPVDGPREAPAGWMFDVGGVVLALDWAPISGGNKQVLALAVVPHADQALRCGGHGKTAPEARKQGSVQLWGFSGAEADPGQLPRPSRQPATYLGAKFFDWGRPKRLQWCPAALDVAGITGALAVVSGDGRAHVIEVKALDHASDGPQFEWIDSPVATLGTADDYNVQVTCLTWLGINRIALGHSDGTITLWSLHPCQLLQRHPVHASFVLDISSAYPSHPYLVASTPVGGCPALTDLSQPSSESTYIPSPAIAFQPGLLSWNEPMQGWLGMYPSSNAAAATLAFFHMRYFCQPRTMATLPSAPMSLSGAGPHPFAIVGCADGSIWGFNALAKLLKLKEEQSFKIKLSEHEFRPAMDLESPDAERRLRGASRILHGFLPVVNEDPRTERLRTFLRKKAQKGKARSGKKGRSAKNAVAGDELNGDDGATGVGDADGGASRFIIHEPLTRVTAVAWNPNVEFGCWAAMAVGSGLVRVLDLGVE